MSYTHTILHTRSAHAKRPIQWHTMRVSRIEKSRPRLIRTSYFAHLQRPLGIPSNAYTPVREHTPTCCSRTASPLSCTANIPTTAPWPQLGACDVSPSLCTRTYLRVCVVHTDARHAVGKSAQEALHTPLMGLALTRHNPVIHERHHAHTILQVWLHQNDTRRERRRSHPRCTL